MWAGSGGCFFLGLFCEPVWGGQWERLERGWVVKMGPGGWGVKGGCMLWVIAAGSGHGREVGGVDAKLSRVEEHDC